MNGKGQASALETVAGIDGAFDVPAIETQTLKESR
jgi:hypothetical protein